MATFIVYNLEGSEVGNVDQPTLFTTPVDQKLIHRYLTWVRNQLRHQLAHTKTRGEVRGGGKKPWRQKGTGRARVGSSRSPLWRSGGTTFGPRKEQTWATRMPRSERRKALFSALAAKANDNSIIVLDEWTMSSPKTKEVVALLNKLPIEANKKILHLHSTFDKALFSSTSNLQKVESKTITNTNLIDILNHDVILLTKEGLSTLDQHFTPTV